MSKPTWETATSVPEVAGVGRPVVLLLQPGEIRWRVAGPKETAGGYIKNFNETGRLDYHAGIRTVDGQRRLYIWRDR